MNLKRAEIFKIFQENPERIKLQEVTLYADLEGVNQRIILVEDDCEISTDYFYCSKCPKTSMCKIIKAAKNNCRYNLKSHLNTHKKVNY